ncbi:MAG: hypothetical protein HQL11_03660, partial [Candidatus Omnitrophica bacterium]|nr:hypothetical protein [Candidatus Omnitrophota bacterium]
MAAPVGGVRAQASTPFAADSSPVDPQSLRIPFRNVILREEYRGRTPRLVVLFQDAHSNESGQKNLALALSALMREHGFRSVLVEGASTDVTLSPIKPLADERAWEQVARRFLTEGKISGEEYLNLTTDLPMRIIGVEDEALYSEGLEVYAQIASFREPVLAYLRRARIATERLKNRMFPRKLLGLDADADRAGTLMRQGEFGGMVRALLDAADEHSAKTNDLESIHQLEEILRLEESVDFEAANIEKIKLFEAAAARAGVRYEDLVEEAERTAGSVAAETVFLRKVLGLAGRDVSVAGGEPSELSKALDYLERFSRLDIAEVYGEIERLKERVFESALHPDALRLWRLDRYLGLLEAAFQIRLSSDEYRRLSDFAPMFPTEKWVAFVNRRLAEKRCFEDMIPYDALLEERLQWAHRFYRNVGLRDEVFVRKTVDQFDSQGEDGVFLVAGGYHTENLTRLLRAKEISYVVLTPVVTGETDTEHYESVLLSS